MLLYAIVFMNIAFLLYTFGVWCEKTGGELKPWHLMVFWAGLLNDTVGTFVMEKIARHNTAIPFNFHSVTGALAIGLMLFHVLWATVVIVKKDKNMIYTFHQFSILVWGIWLIPFATGTILHVR